ncbi:MAG: hypothetical protein HY216_18050, partial [Candidatus Rokubacteria bacterium]|nr:hypothetical protein [Candidatus Rokubacteria bacterium]
AFFRNVFGLVVILPLRVRHGVGLFYTRRLGLHVLRAVLNVFSRAVPPPELQGVTAAFQAGLTVQVSDGMRAAEYLEQIAQAPALRSVAERLGAKEPAAVAAAIEFVLEGLHLSKKLNKDVQAGRVRYRG